DRARPAMGRGAVRRGGVVRRPPGAGGRAALRLVVGAVYVFLFLPIVAVVLLSFSENISVIDFGHFTLRWYAHLIGNAPVRAAVRFSIELGLLAAGFAVVLGSMAAFGLVRGRMGGKAALQAALYAPIVVPEIIIGVALLILFVLLGLPRGVLTLVIGHSVLI